MSSKPVAFRCPQHLLARLDAAAKELGVPRSRVIMEALRLFIQTVRGRKGRVVPPYRGKELLNQLDFTPRRRAH